MLNNKSRITQYVEYVLETTRNANKQNSPNRNALIQ